MTTSFNILEDPYSPVNQYFPNDQSIMLQNHAWIKMKVQNSPLVLI